MGIDRAKVKVALPCLMWTVYFKCQVRHFTDLSKLNITQISYIRKHFLFYFFEILKKLEKMYEEVLRTPYTFNYRVYT